MPTIQVTISAEAEAILKQKIASGEFADADAVFSEGLRLLKKRELENEAKMVALKKAIEDGLASGLTEPDALDQLIHQNNLSEDDREDLAKLEALRRAIQEAEESENAPPGVFDRLREYIRESARKKQIHASGL
jgi:antitoxin ParD1/3/4